MADRDSLLANAVIKVIGVGGAGGNAINTMIRAGISGVEFIAANTDIQSLQANLAPIKIQLGRELTKGLGAGANPEIGRDAALEDKAIIQEVVGGADMVFITGGLGGGTGTGAAPIIAQVAREMGALTVGVVTKPFAFEGKKRRNHADIGMQNLRNAVDTLITIPNQRLLSIAPPNMPLLDAFSLANDVLLNAVRGINDIINVPGLVNADFADVRTTMSEMGMALMGTGIASGANRAQEAARLAINSPLLEDIDIEGATGLLINITGPASMTMQEYAEAATLIQEAAHEDANVIVGCVIDDTLQDSIRVTVIATGFDRAAVSHPEIRTMTGAPQYQTTQSYGIHGHISQPRMDHGQHFSQQRPQSIPYNSPTQPQTSVPASLPNSMPTPVPTSDYRNNVNSIVNQRPQQTPFHNPIPQSQQRGLFEPTTTPHQPDSYGEQGRDLARRTTPQNMQGVQQRAMASDTQTPALAPAHAPTQTMRMQSEYEDLTKWTLDLAKSPNETTHTSQVSQTPQTTNSDMRSVSGASVCEDDNFLCGDSDTESALNIARELAHVSAADDYETPAFLRRREDSKSI